MSARLNPRSVLGTLRGLALGCSLVVSFFGCSSIIGLGDFTVDNGSGGHKGVGASGEAGQSPSASEAGEGGTSGAVGAAGAAGEGNAPSGGSGGNSSGGSSTGGNAPSGGSGGSAPSIVGCDGKTSFVPNADIVRSCLLRGGCDPTFNPVRNISTCVTFDTQAALPGEQCNLNSKTCADYESCEHVGVAHDDLCGGTKKTRCENGMAINCGNYQGDDRFFDCAALGGGCGTYTYTNDEVYADCTLDVTPDSCASAADDDSSYFCHAGVGGADDLRYYCWGGEAYGSSCSPLAKCTDDLVTPTDTTGGDATCFFSLPHCTGPAVPTCNNGVANDCSDGSLFKYDCGTVGLGCNITSGSEYCLAPGCKAADIDTKCVESCSDDGTQLTFCYGGAPYTVTCADYGFTQCLSDTDDAGNPFAACRF
jgi:hypothetical protein